MKISMKRSVVQFSRCTHTTWCDEVPTEPIIDSHLKALPFFTSSAGAVAAAPAPLGAAWSFSKINRCSFFAASNAPGDWWWLARKISGLLHVYLTAHEVTGPAALLQLVRECSSRAHTATRAEYAKSAFCRRVQWAELIQLLFLAREKTLQLDANDLAPKRYALMLIK